MGISHSVFLSRNQNDINIWNFYDNCSKQISDLIMVYNNDFNSKKCEYSIKDYQIKFDSDDCRFVINTDWGINDLKLYFSNAALILNKDIDNLSITPKLLKQFCSKYHIQMAPINSINNENKYIRVYTVKNEEPIILEYKNHQDYLHHNNSKLKESWKNSLILKLQNITNVCKNCFVRYDLTNIDNKWMLFKIVNPFNCVPQNTDNNEEKIYSLICNYLKTI